MKPKATNSAASPMLPMHLTPHLFQDPGGAIQTKSPSQIDWAHDKNDEIKL